MGAKVHRSLCHHRPHPEFGPQPRPRQMATCLSAPTWRCSGSLLMWDPLRPQGFPTSTSLEDPQWVLQLSRDLPSLFPEVRRLQGSGQGGELAWSTPTRGRNITSSACTVQGLQGVA